MFASMPHPRTYASEQQWFRMTASVQHSRADWSSCCYQLFGGRHRCRRMFLLNHCSYRTYLLLVVLISLLLYYQSLDSTKPSHANAKRTRPVRIIYSIRTSSRFYQKRLVDLLETWISLVKNDAFFVTDMALPNTSETRMVLTRQTCGIDAHSMGSLCCKTAHDFQVFHRHLSNYDWFCHFDDDQYVNVRNLQAYLSTLDSNQPYYIGRNSWSESLKRTKEPFPRPFWFATLGAGVCLSKRTVQLLMPYTQSPSQFVHGCIRENYHDDIYLGFLLHGYLNISLTKNERFHSHLEKTFYSNPQTFLRTFKDEITFGFGGGNRHPYFLRSLYKAPRDPYRMRTLHCLLYTHLEECQRKLHRYLFNSTE